MSACLVVMQPTVLPWAGYFNLMAQADDFIFHDDVQLEKRSWQTRNRLLFNSKESWVSLPIRHSGEAQSIADTEVLIDKKWCGELDRTFSRNYGKHPHYADARDVLELLLTSPITSLSELNGDIIRFTADKLNIAPRLHRSSELGIPGVRSDRLIAFCKHFSADEYLSPLGSAEYLELDRFAVRAPAVLRFQNYAPQHYPQKGAGEFVSHLSILDVIANLGWDMTRQYVRGGITY